MPTPSIHGITMDFQLVIHWPVSIHMDTTYDVHASLYRFSVVSGHFICVFHSGQDISRRLGEIEESHEEILGLIN